MNILQALTTLAEKEEAVAKAHSNLAKVLKSVASKTEGIPVNDPAVLTTDDGSEESPESSEEKKPEEKKLAETVKITIDEVRSVLAELSQAGKTASVKELLSNHGAAKLSSVDPSEYAALIEEAKALA